MIATIEGYCFGIGLELSSPATSASLPENARPAYPQALLNTAQHASVDAGIEMEGEAYGRLRSSDDFREGVESFHEKRKPVWCGT